MKLKALTVAVCTVISGSFADLINVAQNQSVSLNGTFFHEYVDWSTTAPNGSPASPQLISSIVDGIFLPEQTQWDQNTLWWDEHGQGQAEVTITLDQVYEISSFIVQADNNDSYRISYLNGATNQWQDVTSVAGWGMMTRPEIQLSESIITSQLKVVATSGDGWYSLSEIQAFGNAVPEPGILSCLSLGLFLLSTVVIRRKTK